MEKLLSRIINVFSELFNVFSALSLYLRNVVIFFNSFIFLFLKLHNDVVDTNR